MNDIKYILDACCGGRMFWFDKSNANTIYMDNRIAGMGHNAHRPNHTVQPDIVGDFREMKFPDKSFKLVIFDPPHLHLSPKSQLGENYGRLDKFTWESDLTRGFNECWRVLDDLGTLIFKWNEGEIKLTKVLSLFPIKPMLGHGTRSKTVWCIFFKVPE